MTRMARGEVALAAVLLLLSPDTVAGRTWSSSGYGDVNICLDETDCGLYRTALTLVGLDEYDSSGASGNYHFTMSASDTALAFGAETNGTCGSSGTCTTRTGEAAVPNGGVMYSTPAINSDPVLRYSVLEVKSGVVSEFIGGVNMALPTTITTGDMMFSFEFENWVLAASDSTLNFTFRINTLIDGYESNSAYMYDVSGNVKRLMLGNSIYADLPTLSNATGSPIYTRVGYSQSGSLYVEVEVSLPASSLVKYSFAMWFVPQTFSSNSSSGGGGNDATTSSSELAPLSVLNFFSGGFEFCAAANCSINTGVLSVALDRLGTTPTLTNTLTFGTLITDFTEAPSLPFSDPIAADGIEVHPLILQISDSGDVQTIKDSSLLLDSSSPDDSSIFVLLTVRRLEEEDSITIMGETLTAPAGALHVSLAGNGLSNSAVSLGSVGISFFLFAMEDGGVVTNVTTGYSGMYTRRMNISDMYLLYSMYGTIDGYEYPVSVQPLAYKSGDNQGLIQLLFEFGSVTDAFTYEFYIGSNSIQYGNASTATSTGSSASGSQATVIAGITNSPNVSMIDAKPILTKMIKLPHGEFGLCFDASCSTSAVKVGFSGLASSEGERLGRFADAAAFVFSEPEHTNTPNGDEVWSTSFTALVPQSRIQPPIPYNETLAASYPTFSVRVDQYLTTGRAMNAGRTLTVPRGALKFSFNISNWQFKSSTDKIVLNATLSSIIGDVPGASGFSVTTLETDLLRISFGDDQFLDIPLLAELDGSSTSVSITPVIEADVGIVLVMEFSYFTSTLVYDPVMASQALVIQDVVNMRSPAKRNIIRAAAITLTAILGLMIIAAAIRCLRKVPVKVNFHDLFF